MVKTCQVCVLAACVVAGGAAAVGAAERASAADARSADRPASIPFEVVRHPDGGIEILVHGPGVEFRKTSYQGGRFVMQIATEDDRLGIAAGDEAITVSRNRQSVSMSAAGARREALDKIRRLLEGGTAAGALHEFAGSLDERAQESPAVYAILVADAFVSVLTGDIEATKCLVQRAREARARSSRGGGGARVRPAQWVDCWVGYSGSLMTAFGDMISCIGETAWLGDVGLLGCEGVYFLRAEGYWFEYLSCSAIPLRLA
jgi:hypothetical protein